MLKKFRALLWVALLLPSIITAADETPVVLVVGDSLSAGYGLAPQEGWVALLERRLTAHNPRFRVVNASVSGDTTLNGRNRLDGLLTRQRPAIVIIELGANDGLRGLSLAAMKANLAAMIGASQARGARVLLVGMRLPPNYGPVYGEHFHTVYRDLARDHRVPLVPFLLEGVGDNLALMQRDTLHPIARAQPRLLANVWTHLEPMLKQPEPVAAPEAERVQGY